MVEQKVKLIMVMGIPASGKSTFARNAMSEVENVTYLSSDLLRLELFGDMNNQKNNNVVFDEMLKRTRKALSDGKHVIYDATNINRKRRKSFLSQLPSKTEKAIVYMATDYNTILEQNINRDRVIQTDVIEKMYKSLHPPVYGEGWDKIVFCYDDKVEIDDLPKQFTDAVRAGVLFGREGYDLMNFLSSYFTEFHDIHEFPQDSKYHSFTVSRHTYHVYRYVLENYITDDVLDKELMLWVALLHDTGKRFTKSFYNFKGEEKRYASFIGHENVSSQLAVNILKRLNFEDQFIYNAVTLIQFHMYLLNEDNDKQKLINYVGEDLYKKLEFLRKADTQAH